MPALQDPVAVERPDVDLLDPLFHVGDPHPAYRWMRANEPIYRDTHNALWCITKIEHLRHVERHASTFVSSRGYRSVWVPSETSMISKDDPAHQQQRKLVADRFTPRAVQELENDVRDVVQQAIRLIGLGDRCEVVDTLAARIPSILTCRLIGWDDVYWRDVRSWSERVMRIDTMGANLIQLCDGMRAVNEIAALVGHSIEAKDDLSDHTLLARWIHGDQRGCPMNVEEINSELGLVIPGGAETTRTTMARALILFSERNDLWELLAENPQSIPLAVEELFRWITPLNNMFRTVAHDTEIGGIEMTAGDRVALVYPSANRDEDVFTNPDEIDFSRDPNPHIAFGFGTHFCLGAHVARLTMRVALEELTRTFTNLRACAPPGYEANVFVKAVERFELGFDRR